jgi:hypothetical protein
MQRRRGVESALSTQRRGGAETQRDRVCVTSHPPLRLCPPTVCGRLRLCVTSLRLYHVFHAGATLLSTLYDWWNLDKQIYVLTKDASVPQRPTARTGEALEVK